MKKVDVMGQRFGKWIIIKEQGRDSKNNILWLCRCDCGTEVTTKVQNIKNGKSVQCVKCAVKALTIDSYNDTLPDAIWMKMLTQAKRRKIDVEVTKDEVCQILIHQDFKCALSGIPIHIATNPLEYRQLKQTASLDRIDSSKGYIKNNLQWVHKTINLMKNIIGNADFIELCSKITHYNGKYMV